MTNIECKEIDHPLLPEQGRRDKLYKQDRSSLINEFLIHLPAWGQSYCTNTVTQAREVVSR